MSKKTIEERYKKLSQREHVLRRPATYIGSINSELKKIYVVEDINNFDDIKIVNKIVSYNPGFIKIFDEILSNASDHSIRTGKVKYIKIIVNEDNISIENDGPGIPIEIHKEHNCYVPEMLFGSMLTGENYDDDDDRVVIGTNGIGSKAVNIFSNKFIVETADGKNKYTQVFEKNLEIINTPKIEKSSKNYTKITYYPDFERFGLTSNTEEIQKILLRRTLDVAACTNVSLYYNDKLVPLKSFKDYMKLHLEDGVEIFYEKLNDDWEVGISSSFDDNFQQVSLVNSNNTYLGGTHVNYVTNQIVTQITETLEKKHKKIKIKPNDVKNKLFIFLNAKVVNPTFDSQTKENLTTRLTQQHIGNVNVSDKLIKQLAQSEIVEDILNYIQLRENAELKKLNKGKTSKVKIKKLDDANMAGTSSSEKCILFLTEGDCLIEDTMITIIRDGDKLNIPIKEVKIGDAVITHENNIGVINGVSKKIEKSVKIKLKNGEILICSENHRWYVYDKIDSKFIFIETKKLDKNRHKMIINKNTFYDDFIKILEIEKCKKDKYDYILTLSTGEILSSETHKFSVFNKEEYKFEMIECKDLIKDIHMIVSYEKL